MTGACIVMTLFVMWVLASIGDWYALGAWTRTGALAGCVIGAVIVYFAGCYLFGLRPPQFRGPTLIRQG